MPRVPRSAMRIGPEGREAYPTVSEREIIRIIFFEVFLLTGLYWNQLAMYSWSTRRLSWISRRLPTTRFQLHARNQKARSELCSHSRQHMTTVRSRAVMENQLRR